jgi:predicted Zn-dependent peptidase
VQQHRLTRPLATALALLAAFSFASFAQTPAPPIPKPDPYQQLLEQRTTVKVLPNGLTLVLSERHEAPVFSFYTLVNAGSANDPEGESGLAHMFEHIAFKGTDEIGTTNYPAEKVALAKVETAYAAYDDAYLRSQRGGPVEVDPAQLAKLKHTFDDAVEAAQKYVIPNQFSEIAESNGAVDLNASTSEDSTQYFWSMPSNRLELWAYLESSRIAHPVAREFYKERDVVNEERRMRIDSSPQGRLVEEFLAAAYMAHHYGTPGVGWESDITQVSATEAAAFHKKYYVPSNLVVAVVGDIDTKTALPMLEKYFGRIPAGPNPEPMTTVEPEQKSERTVVLHEATQPIYLEGYHRPDYRDPDDAVYSAITDIFSNGRTSRLYKSLVRDQRIAVVAEGFSGFPGVKYPGLFAFYAVPQGANGQSAGHTAAELERFKARARAGLLQTFGDNDSLASELADYQTRFGDWREIFRELQQIDAVTKADIRRVAQKTFVDSNRTVSSIEFQAPTEPPAPPASAGKGGAR